MAKLFIGLMFLFITPVIFAQESLYVFQVKGNVEGKNKLFVQKGDKLNEIPSIKLAEGALLNCIDESGNSYTINKKGTYTYADILKKVKKPKSQLTVTYLRYLWNELLGVKGSTTTIAGVFRGDVLMSYPPDSAFVLNKGVRLQWSSDSEVTAYFVFYKSEGDEEFKKIETKNTHLEIEEFEKTSIEWAVSTKPFPNLKNVPLFTFTTIDSNEWKDKQKSFKPLKSDLKRLSFTSEEIDEIICEMHKVCKNK